MKTKKMIEMKDGIVILTWMLIGILLCFWSPILIVCLSRFLIVFFYSNSLARRVKSEYAEAEHKDVVCPNLFSLLCNNKNSFQTIISTL